MTQRILAINDSPDIHELLRVRLKNQDVTLRSAFSAVDALRKADEELPDLILLDVCMPDMSGFDLCKQLKSRAETASIPIIFLTGASEVSQKVLGFEAGAVDYIEKPFESEELNARVRAALRTKRYFDLLSQRAMIDGLTGLWNRAHFDQRLAEEVSTSQRYDRPLSLVMLDLDRFKSINDTYGHPFGDEVLQVVGYALLKSARTSDSACRYGGEEFVIILRETNSTAATTFAERVRHQIESLPLKCRGERVSVTASFGISANDLCMNPCELDRQWLLETADRALYAAKQGGRNRVCVAEKK